MYVETILRKKGDSVVTVDPADTVSDAVQVLSKHRIGAALVRDAAGGIVGILSERDIVRGVARDKSNCLDMAVKDLMTSPVISCKPDDNIDEIMELMTERRIRHLPVMNGDALVGIISIGDVVKQRISEIENESEALRQYITTG
ncbi:MAG: CBS domain-containing protein [Alphaproteobacteria bacterium]|nr:CBS domain-containing protein [Alphaproteobacteria bacterium]